MEKRLRIAIITPLFPPDTGGCARYIKTLTQRLSASHDVSLLTYGHIPEKVENVLIASIDKRLPLPLRLTYFFIELMKITKRADIIYLENGASTELPMRMVSFLKKTPYILHVGDTHAQKHDTAHPLRSLIHRSIKKGAYAVITHSPVSKPDILPFHPHPAQEQEVYETSWKEHMTTIEELISDIQ